MKRFMSFSILLLGGLLLIALQWGNISCSAPTPAAPVTVTQYVNVTATFTPTGSPTPTPTPVIPQLFTFEGSGSGTNDYWYLSWGGANAPANSVSVIGTGFNSSYGLNLIFSGTTGDTDLQAEVTDTAKGFPLDFSAHNFTGVVCYVNIDPSAFPTNSQYSLWTCPYIKTGGTVPVYGGCYNGWANANPQAGPNSTGNTWFTVTLSPTGGTWAADSTNVTGIGVDVNMTEVATNVVIDNVTLF